LSLIDALVRSTGAPANSFELTGEALWLVTPHDLVDAAERYRDAVESTVPVALRERYRQTQTDWMRRAHRWLARDNRNLHGRVRGYLRLARLCRWAYPWPVVAVLGISQVIEGMGDARLYGLAGRVGLRPLVRLADAMEDLLRRTNRGIFGDSVPTVLYALGCHELRCNHDEALAEALLSGPLPLPMDEESRSIASGLYRDLAIEAPQARFEALTQRTLEHFEREQAIFTHHLGGERRGPVRSSGSRLWRWVSSPRSVPAPTIVRDRRGARLEFQPRRLSSGFTMHDHTARVRELGDAFVRSVTGSLDDYRLAAAWAASRFGEAAPRIDSPTGGAAAPDPAEW